MKALYGYKLPLLDGSMREGLILQLGQGFGDIAPLPGFSRETLEEATKEALNLLSEIPNTEPTLASVKFAYFCASRPLCSSINIQVNALNTHRSGFTALKLKLGYLSLSDAIALVKTAPKGVELRLDFNRRWPLSKLLAFADHFHPDSFAYLEEPTARFEDLLSFSKQTGFPIAVDESIPYIPYREIPTLKALVVKPTVLGYIPTPPPGVELIFSSAYESGVGLLHLAQLAGQHSPTRPHGLDPYSHFREDLLFAPLNISEGRLIWQPPLVLRDSSLCLVASAP